MVLSSSFNRAAVAGLRAGTSRPAGGSGSSGHGASTGTGGGVAQPASEITAASISRGQLGR